MSGTSVFNIVRLGIVFTVTCVCVLHLIGFPFHEIKLQHPVIKDPFDENKWLEINKKIESLESNTKENIKNLNSRLSETSKDIEKVKEKVSNANPADEITKKIESLKSNFESSVTDLKSKIDELENKETTSNSQEIEKRVLEKVDKKAEAAFLDLEKKLGDQIKQKQSTIYSDRNGMVDFALKSAGARIVESMTSETYDPYSQEASPLQIIGEFIFGVSHPLAPPSLILDPTIVRGKCWPMNGKQGFVTIQLPSYIIPTEFTLEHIPKRIATETKSAPHEVEVYGVNETNQEETILAQYKYIFSDDILPYQTFGVKPQVISSKPKFSRFKLKVLSNYGNPSYTCIYRFSIHGQQIAIQ